MDPLIGARRKVRVTIWCEVYGCEQTMEIVFDDINIVEDDIMDISEERGWTWDTGKRGWRYWCPEHSDSDDGETGQGE